MIVFYKISVGPTFIQMGVQSESWISQLATDLNTDTDLSVSDLTFIFYSIHHLIMKSLHFWGEILRFPSKSLDKSSDCADFIKSIDLSDWSENIKFSLIIFLTHPINSVNYNYNYNSKSSVWNFQSKMAKSLIET